MMKMYNIIRKSKNIIACGICSLNSSHSVKLNSSIWRKRLPCKKSNRKKEKQIQKNKKPSSIQSIHGAYTHYLPLYYKIWRSQNKKQYSKTSEIETEEEVETTKQQHTATSK